MIEKIDQIRKYSGEKYEIADVAEAGEIVAVTVLARHFRGRGSGLSSSPICQSLNRY